MDETPQSFPVRRKLPHGPPPFMVSGSVVQFVTINAVERGGMPFLPVSLQLLDSARFYHDRGRWFLRLFLIMPDHLHMLATFPDGRLKETCGAWKRYVAGHFGVSFQTDCFEHRIRDAAELSEKWMYIRENPVRKGLVSNPNDWPYWMSFDPQTGEVLYDGGANSQSEPS